MSERIRGIRANVKDYALQFLRQGREGWDIEHTRAVAYYAEKIATSEGLDTEVLIAAAWLHDIGYYGLFEDADPAQYTHITDRKQLHMIIGAKLAEKFFQTPEAASLYTPQQIQKIVHLVEVHDDFEKLGKSREEIVLMEADTLGSIDLKRVTPTFDYKNGINYIEALKGKRLPRFQTMLGKQFLAELLPLFVAYFEKKKP